MKKLINTQSWKKFKVGDLFKINTVHSYHRRHVTSYDISKHFKKESINYITRSIFNNGITNIVVKDDNFVVNPAGVLTFGAVSATFFYQEEEFIAGRDMYWVDTKIYTKNINLFLASILNGTLSNRYKFSEALSATRLRKESIKLPVTVKDEPDWEFMDNYVDTIQFEADKRFKTLNKINNIEIFPLPSHEWGEFKIGDYFSVDSPPARRITDYESGEYPFVTSGEKNNGITHHLNLLNDETPHAKGTITVSPLGGISFYQPKPFLARGGAGSSINILYKEGLTEAQALFITTIIRKTASNYSFNDMLSKTKLKNLFIKLPKTEDDMPDWELMDNYIKVLESEVNSKFENLTSIVV